MSASYKGAKQEVAMLKNTIEALTKRLDALEKAEKAEKPEKAEKAEKPEKQEKPVKEVSSAYIAWRGFVDRVGATLVSADLGLKHTELLQFCSKLKEMTPISDDWNRENILEARAVWKKPDQPKHPKKTKKTKKGEKTEEAKEPEKEEVIQISQISYGRRNYILLSKDNIVLNPKHKYVGVWDDKKILKGRSYPEPDWLASVLKELK